MPDKCSISIVIPVFNEGDSLDKLYCELSKVLEPFSVCEIIFVDDGSYDNSFTLLKKIADEDSRVAALRFFKNFGKADALSEGFKHTSGDIIITMDADLQDDPAEIPNFINKIQEGWDLVSGWKKNRKDPLSKRIPSRLFNFVTRLFTGVNIHDFNCGLKAYRRKVINAVDIYGGLHRYIPAMASQKGFSVTEIEVHHRPREFGQSKYGSNRFLHGFFDLFTMLFTSKYFNRPLHFFGFIGMVLFMAGLIISIYLTVGWFNGIWIGNRPIFFFGILLLIVGAQFFSLGLLGELFIKNTAKSEKKVYSVYTSHQN